MGWFSRAKDIPTEEERYRARKRQEAERRARAERFQATQRRMIERHDAAVAERRGRVKKVGTLRKIGRDTWETKGWVIEGVDDRENKVVHDRTLGGLTVRDLCALSHGSSCRCTNR